MSTEHKARVARIDSITPIEGADRIQVGYILGNQIIIGKDLNVGDIGILFDGELRLSKEYCSENNLFRDKALNKDKEKTGYFDANAKVRVQRLMKVRSEAVFMPLESLLFAGEIDKLSLGDSFDTFNGVKICEKYISEQTRAAIARQKGKKVKHFQSPLFKEHLDSQQLKYYIDKIPKGTLITGSLKYHGTSFRVSNTKIISKLPRWKEFINKIYPIFSNESWDYVAGSRRVVLFQDQKEKVGFHGPEKYRFDVLESFKPYLTRGLVVYGELVGFVNGSPIMSRHDVTKIKDKSFTKKYGETVTYKYGCQVDEYKVKVYRITLTGDDGDSVDFSPAQVQSWCEKRGFSYVKTLIPTFVYDGDSEKLMELANKWTENSENLTEDYEDPSHVLEGIVLRCDSGDQAPCFYKHKSFIFRLLEGHAKEEGVDEEDAA